MYLLLLWSFCDLEACHVLMVNLGFSECSWAGTRVLGEDITWNVFPLSCLLVLLRLGFIIGACHSWPTFSLLPTPTFDFTSIIYFLQLNVIQITAWFISKLQGKLRYAVTVVTRDFYYFILFFFILYLNLDAILVDSSIIHCILAAILSSSFQRCYISINY